MLTSSYQKFEGLRIWIKTAFLPVLVVSAFKCFHTGGISLYCVGLRPHQPINQKQLLPSKVNGSTVGATVAFATVIDCAWMTNVTIFCNSTVESVLGVWEIVAYIGAVAWIPVTRKINCHLSHLILFCVIRMGGNLITVATCFFVLIAWTVPALNQAIIGITSVLTSSVAKTILLLTKLRIQAAGFGLSINLSTHANGNENKVCNIYLPQEPSGGSKVWLVITTVLIACLIVRREGAFTLMFLKVELVNWAIVGSWSPMKSRRNKIAWPLM